jgi:hypothetical protein
VKTPPIRVQVRLGVARFDDGWNVIADIGGKRQVYDPTFATEAEAEAKAHECAALLREVGVL